MLVFTWLRPISRRMCVCVFCAAQAPPFIIEDPPDPVKYLSGNKNERVELPCRATGNPEI